MAKDIAKMNTGLPVALAKQMEADESKGVSKDQEDNLVPLIYVLQAQSPQVKKKGSEYIDGAEPGSIWLRNVSDPIVDGDDGFMFQPCYFYKNWVEWIPRDSGGGFIANHMSCPDDAARTEDPKNPNKVSFIRPNGNEMIETRYHVGLVHGRGAPLPFVIPMASSGHSVSRAWMFMMNSRQLPNGKVAPSFGQMYRLKTKERSNASGDWFAFDVVDEGWVTDEKIYKLGLALHNAFVSGEKQADAPLEEDVDSPEI